MPLEFDFQHDFDFQHEQPMWTEEMEREWLEVRADFEQMEYEDDQL